ncbi:unnamed protein product [Adineta steineri]|uniref:Uncharacterized protein n=1 Tax=Adineta steineri TaxID=433720 RepID=A0A814UV39_9BILA|nr:unnamed protein product [Adineta steineri]CAF1178874.1 unnamed protein product [Adineta steineri]CAF3520888.1 unnamed protein product [Adineta steineri]CAF3833358.1 unnamed protein product [Adineta steineri]
MIHNLCLLAFIAVFFGTINALPYYRFRRQINWPPSRPSGSIPGSSYYGVGSDPNYGSLIATQNSPESNIVPISYNPNSNAYNSLIKPSYQQQPQQQQQNYMYNNNNNAWLNPNGNNYYNQQSNRYSPGSQGWYATGGNYWYNKGQSIVSYPYLLITSILLLMICK